MQFYAGQPIRFEGPFTDLSGVAIDPTVVTFSWTVGIGGTWTEYTYGVPGSPIVRDAPGMYHVDLDTTGQPGMYTGEWASNGVGKALDAIKQWVDPAPYSPTFPA